MVVLPINPLQYTLPIVLGMISEKISINKVKIPDAMATEFSP